MRYTNDGIGLRLFFTDHSKTDTNLLAKPREVKRHGNAILPREAQMVLGLDWFGSLVYLLGQNSAIQNPVGRAARSAGGNNDA
jgi:hypothetical protein